MDLLGPPQHLLRVHQVVARIRDWDDNVLHMRGADFYLVRIGHQYDPEMLQGIRDWVSSGQRNALAALLAKGVLKGPISTREFSYIRRQLNQPLDESNPWAGYSAHPNTASPPLLAAEEFRDRNFFREHLAQALADPWARGPQWKSYIRDLSDPATAEWTGVLTSRTMAPEVIYDGHDLLIQRGHVRYRPNRQLILPVNNNRFRAKLGASLDRPERAKFLAGSAILDRLQMVPLLSRALRVSADIGPSRAMHLFEFSDDDYDTIDVFAASVADCMKARPDRWRNVKVMVRYTGEPRCGLSVGATLVVERNQVRAVTDGELQWIAEVVEANQRYVVPAVLYRLMRRVLKICPRSEVAAELEIVRADLSWLVERANPMPAADRSWVHRMFDAETRGFRA